jgi:biopolymer transport protein ExbD
MADRNIKEINAGSMADIAFLLLIFFLVTTTMDVDQGLLTQLPAIPEDNGPNVQVPEYKVFKVMVNAQDELLVEDDELSIYQLKREAKAFLSNGGVFEDLIPDDSHVDRERWITEAELLAKIAVREGKQLEGESKGQLDLDLKKLHTKLQAVRLFGAYKELDKSAVISVQLSNEASYNTFIQVQNELSAAVNELRDELCHKHFSKSYLDLDTRDPQEREYVMAVRQIYPQRVSEAEPF